jgi:hypothetical protein
LEVGVALSNGSPCSLHENGFEPRRALAYTPAATLSRERLDPGRTLSLVDRVFPVISWRFALRGFVCSGRLRRVMGVAQACVESRSVEALAEEIATFAARIDAAKHALLTLLRRFDELEGFGRYGAMSTAHWLSWRTGMRPAAAREHVRVARALGGFPRVDAAMRKGELSYSRVRAITRVATARTEEDLLNLATYSTASQLERVCRAYRSVLQDASNAPVDRRRFVRRQRTPDGMVRLSIQLPPEEAELVWEAMTRAMESPKETAAATTSEDRVRDSAESPGAAATTLADRVRDSAETPGPRPRPRRTGSAIPRKRRARATTPADRVRDSAETPDGATPAGAAGVRVEGVARVSRRLARRVLGGMARASAARRPTTFPQRLARSFCSTRRKTGQEGEAPEFVRRIDARSTEAADSPKTRTRRYRPSDPDWRSSGSSPESSSVTWNGRKPWPKTERWQARRAQARRDRAAARARLARREAIAASPHASSTAPEGSGSMARAKCTDAPVAKVQAPGEVRPWIGPVERGPMERAANDGVGVEERRADALVAVAEAYLRSPRCPGGSGLSLLLITTREHLALGGAGAAERAGSRARRCEHGVETGQGAVLFDGMFASLAATRRVACDAAIVEVTRSVSGEVLDVGRRTRSIPPAIRRALWLRDAGGCRFPGCTNTRHLDGHHIEHWADGGATSLDNLVQLCRLCRARHNRHYAASVVMPRRRPLAALSPGRQARKAPIDYAYAA